MDRASTFAGIVRRSRLGWRSAACGLFFAALFSLACAVTWLGGSVSAATPGSQAQAQAPGAATQELAPLDGNPQPARAPSAEVAQAVPFL